MSIHYRDDLVTVHHGDCLDVLAELADASVDAVITDPPYGLEFMGKEWDAPWRKTSASHARARERRAAELDDPVKGKYIRAGVNAYEAGQPFQQWCTQWAAECLRVLKPGGHMLAFGGSRTWHRLAAAIEDAGFEIRDSIAWLYGCLTDDVEVLTPTGWRRGIDVAVGDEVAQWNPVTGAITAAPVQRTYRAPWHGELVRFRNSDTDQLLTPNHRVWYRNNDHRGADGRAWREWSEYRVADAGSIGRRSPIRLPLAGEHNGPGVGGVDYAALLGWVWTEGGFDRSGSGVRIYQSSVNQQHCDTIAALLDRLTPHKRYDYQRTYKRRSGERHTYTASTWFLTGDVAERVRRDLPDKHPTYELLWRMTLDEKRAFIAAALDGDGSQSARGAWQFYQSDRADREWFATALSMVGWRGHVSDRPAPRTGGAVSVSQRADTTLTPKALRENAAEFYSGEVWCIGVPTGAFVARRHGLVFITGNSGFPKSLDVSKAIDKAAGAEREATGTARGHVPTDGGNFDDDNYQWRAVYERKDNPATDAAKQWQGWGTALKPAFEPIVVARKPLVGTVAANVLEHGTGALNIDACRVGTQGGGSTCPGGDACSCTNKVFGGTKHPARRDGEFGRWPTNVVLDDAQAAELDAQTGITTSRKGKPRTGANGHGWGMTATGAEYDDEGGASRFFPVFRYEAKAPGAERPSVVTTKLRLRADLTPEQVDRVVARLREVGVEVD
ncbi:DNA methylase [Mycobacterium phage KilKor]|uniref:DNA methylase n=2 Tax=Fishburnevirus TaxID=1983734 RepID=A0A6B9SXX3_9CAUD|nr:DNA methyltransferase [Mycobacterium phage Willsammy]YP_010001354.1 DNA methyltransferase [Mycobacterium phage KilKor]QHJ86484.1 DNA methylase [Mycobacterium phage KilKor]QIN94275.1 DNA methylase [Mycobacterium phage Willsammy]